MRRPPLWLRAFFYSFAPVALVLACGAWATQIMVTRQIKDGLRESLRQTHAFVGKAQAHQELQNQRFLSVVSENPVLKAGMELALLEREDEAARRTLEEQLVDYGERLAFDLLVATDNAGEPLAMVRRDGDALASSSLIEAPRGTEGVVRIGGRPYTISALPVSLREETIGALTVGRLLDLSDFAAAAALTRDGKLIETNLTLSDAEDLERGLANCAGVRECELEIGEELYLAAEFDSLPLGAGYRLHSLQSLDAIQGPLQRLIRRVAWIAGSVALVLVLLTSLASARSVVRPITTLSERLERIPPDGVPPTLTLEAGTREVEQLVVSFNHASVQIREARARLTDAHEQFLEAMTSAVDARDVYTLGHSRRVSGYAVQLAAHMGLPAEEIEILRVGGLLHDVGKIGIPDAVLRKPARLTPEETRLIEQHPVIGRHIVERVDGFAPYLPIIELHHENYDGSGYPYGQRGEETPLAARIVHVVDAYDAMTSDRPYRSGMTHEQATAILAQFSGTQFDPEIVRKFLRMGPAVAVVRSPGAVSLVRQLNDLSGNLAASASRRARKKAV